MEDFQGSEYLNDKKIQYPTVGYKLFLNVNGKFLSLVADNPMEFEENKEYIAHGDASVGKNSFCFGTSDDLDVLAFAGEDAKIAVGVITIYPPYFLYHDDSRDCVNLGYSQHIVVNEIMKFDEIYKFSSKKGTRSKKLIEYQYHNLGDERLKELIDKYAGDNSFACKVKDIIINNKSQSINNYSKATDEEKKEAYLKQAQKDEENLNYLLKKEEEYKIARKRAFKTQM